MREVGEINIVNHEGTVPRVVSFVNSERINHYSDVVDMMVKTEVARFEKEHGFAPQPSQIAGYRREVIRYAVIRREVKKASELKIPKSNIIL